LTGSAITRTSGGEVCSNSSAIPDRLAQTPPGELSTTS
jgi:hypothetical protein